MMILMIASSRPNLLGLCMTNRMRWEYGDPAEIYERKEGRTCKGCKFLRREASFFGSFVETCKKNVPKRIKPWSEGKAVMAKCGEISGG
jgi:hypothetical protein